MAAHPYTWVSTANVASAEALSDETVRVVLKGRDASFLTSTLVGLPMLPKHIYGGVDASEQFTDVSATAGSGPYRLVSFDKAQRRYLLGANADYLHGKPAFDQVAIVEMVPEAAIEAVKAGDVDIISDLPFDLIDKAREAGLNVTTAASNHPVRLGFNHRGLFGDVTLRQAMAYSLDREALVEIAFHDAAVVADVGFFQAGSPWANSEGVPAYGHDTDKARQLFSDSGWSRGDDGVWMCDGERVVLRLITDRSLSNAAVVLADLLEQSGISLDIQVMEVAALQEAVKAGDYDLTVFATSTLGDPRGIARRVLTPVWNSDAFPDSDGSLKTLLDAQAVAIDAGERQAILQQFQVQYAQFLPSLMLANPIWASAYNDKAEPHFLPGGVAIGIPSALHKSMFLR